MKTQILHLSTVAAPGLLADQQPPSPPSLPSSEIHNTPSPTTTPAQSRIPNPQALESLPSDPGPENMAISSTRSSNGNSRIWPPTREKETSGWVACKPVDSSSLPLFHFGSIFVFFTFLVNTIHGLFVFKLRPRRVERESTKELFIGSGMNEESTTTTQSERLGVGASIRRSPKQVCRRIGRKESKSAGEKVGGTKERERDRRRT